MGYLKMDFAGVDQIARNITNASNENTGKLSALTVQAAPDAVWEGEAASSYTNAFQRYTAAEKELQAALLGLGQAVNTIKDNFQQINQSGSQAFNSAFGG